MTKPSDVKKPADVQIITDSGWKHQKYSSIPSRGINDYERIMQFAARLTDPQFQAVCHWLEHDNCPGWTGVSGHATNHAPAEYRFTTTYDSSD